MSEIEDAAYAGAENSEERGAHWLQHQPRKGKARRDTLPPRVANPDDPPVRRPPRGPRGPLPGPNDPGAPGRIAIAQGQIYIIGAILVAQLWLITDALYEVLSGRPQIVGWLTLASGIGFLVALIVWRWPSRRVTGI